MRIHALVATMTGTAQLVAQEIELTYADADTEIEISLMDDLTPAVFDTDDTLLIVTSTYGQGDIPDNARQLVDALTRDKPDLSGVRYGLLGLGDITYKDTFNHGGMKFDALLASLGAQRIGERGMLDANSGELPEDMALVWAADWLAAVRAAQATSTAAGG